MNNTTDLLVVGGGIMGLWAALKGAQAGLDVLLVEAQHIGAGASGGLIGALMPHMPERWNEKKQYQFESLNSLESEIQKLEELTGTKASYRRSGRIIPLPKPHLRAIAERHQNEALTNWHQQGHAYNWNVSDRAQVDGLINPEFGEAGYVFDTLAARISPRSYVAIMLKALQQFNNVTIVDSVSVTRVNAYDNSVLLSDGKVIAYGHCVVAAGFEAFPMLHTALLSGQGKPLGMPVKGQAARMAANLDPSIPVIFMNGLYVIAHDDGSVAIGSTSEQEFDEAYSTDELLDALIVKARDLVPALRDAEVVEKWAGLRPKAIGREPMVGAWLENPRIVALAGGFKVSFGLAHSLSEAAIGDVVGVPVPLPTSFTLTEHLRLSLDV